MFLLKHNFKSLALKSLLLVSLFFFADQLNANGFFPEEPVKQETVKKEKKKKSRIAKWLEKKVERTHQRVVKVQERIKAAANRYGTISMWAFIGAGVLSLLAGTSTFFTTLASLIGLASLIAAIIGVTGGDEDKKRARIMLWINLAGFILALILILVLLIILI